MTLIMRRPALCKCEKQVSERKICAYTWVSENLGHSNSKNQDIHILSFLKKGGNQIPGDSEKWGLFGTHIRTLSYLGYLPPPRF